MDMRCSLLYLAAIVCFVVITTEGRSLGHPRSKNVRSKRQYQTYREEDYPTDSSYYNPGGTDTGATGSDGDTGGTGDIGGTGGTGSTGSTGDTNTDGGNNDQNFENEYQALGDDNQLYQSDAGYDQPNEDQDYGFWFQNFGVYLTSTDSAPIPTSTGSNNDPGIEEYDDSLYDGN